MMSVCVFVLFFFFKQKTAYEMRISDWSSDVCSSDLFQKAGARVIGLSADDYPTLAKFSVEACRNAFPVATASPATIKAYDVVQIGRASCRERVCQYV